VTSVVGQDVSQGSLIGTVEVEAEQHGHFLFVFLKAWSNCKPLHRDKHAEP
jgi:hypothetical protein